MLHRESQVREKEMGNAVLSLIIGALAVLGVSLVNAEDPYLYYIWTVTYGTRSILGVPQQVILINNQFPGPKLDVVTNNNIILNLVNKLDQPFLLTWNGIKQRKNSWQDGALQQSLESGKSLPFPDGVLINGQTKNTFSGEQVLHYANSQIPVSGPLPAAPAYQYHWSMQQARTYRWNLTSNAARPNPQGVFSMSAIQDVPSGGAATVATSVMPASLHDFLEVVFQNNENTMQSWHLDGYDFWVVGFGSGQWTPKKRRTYNLVDALTRHTTQVYPNSWTTILVSLDNQVLLTNMTFHLMLYSAAKLLGTALSRPVCLLTNLLPVIKV
ncbi:hypothetical protein V6N13_072305 [Hibiscus sabdariffa]